ncbi:MAG: pantoate--beta-alanine ligase [Flavobacteriales bacterium]|nr:pantoate--beta-alanine ligase [Flavobacteriales bacterium]
MQIFHHKKNLKTCLNKLYDEKKTIGFVPTMGAIHEGHLKLILESKKKCDITICSIFINPTQFNNKKDFANYPKTLSQDIKLLAKSLCDILYCPDVDDLYDRIITNTYNFNSLTQYMEGVFRPGHFNGMATVVEKLLKIIKPDLAFFGQKDLQQLQIVKKLVAQMNCKTKIVGVNTYREKNGLAKSSRNKLLTTEQKRLASNIFKSLVYCKENKHLSIENLKNYVQSNLEKHKIELEYVEFVEIQSMTPVGSLSKGKKIAICIAAYLDDVRLIDNIIL